MLPLISSIVFLIVGFIIKTTFETFFIKIALIGLCTSSTIFHMLDHEIDDHDNIMNTIYIIDMFFIVCVGSYIITRSSFYSILMTCVGMLLYDPQSLSYFIMYKNIVYIVGWLRIIMKIIENANIQTYTLLIAIILIQFLSFYMNDRKYGKEPYHISWYPTNAINWHIINGVLIYIGII